MQKNRTLQIQLDASRSEVRLLVWALGLMALVGLMGLWPTMAHASNGGDLPRFYGVIAAKPASGNVGTWTLGSRNFVADAGTEFGFQFGPLDVGTCAQVKYNTVGGSDIAVQIESQPATDCGPDGTPSPSPSVSPTPSETPSVSPTPSETPEPTETATPIPAASNRAYGLVSELPANRIGTWVIGGVSYAATTSTEFKTESGAFAVNSCVKVKYFIDDAQTPSHRAIEIETESASDCNGLSGGSGSDDSSRSTETAKVNAPIGSLPVSPFVGTWVLGGVSYQAITSTRMEQSKGTFVAGACVEARYVVSNSVNTLTRVETTEAYKCQTVVGANPAPVFRGYGVIESFPQNLIGLWRVGNITYTTNVSTVFEQPQGLFAIGAFVEVKYQVISDTLVAVKIETHVAPRAGMGDDSGHLETHPDDHWGNWVIDGVTYKGDDAIEVELESERPGLRAMSASVAAPMVVVNYYVSNGVRIATSVRQLAFTVALPMALR